MGISHAGIYVGEGRFVHAPSSGGTVRLDSLSNSYWQRAYLDAKRVFTPAGQQSLTAPVPTDSCAFIHGEPHDQPHP